MSKKIRDKEFRHSFRAKLWKHKGSAAWFFLTLPKTLSRRIRRTHVSMEEGWGRLKATAKIGDAQWSTSIWFDTRRGAYLLPVKKEVRRKEGLDADATVTVTLRLAPLSWEDRLLGGR